MDHILVEDNRDMSMPSDMSLFLYMRISGRMYAVCEFATDRLGIERSETERFITTKKT